MKRPLKYIEIGEEIPYLDIEVILMINSHFCKSEISICNNVGESFIVLKHDEKDLTVSFMLSGHNSNGNIYKCIYSDYQKS